MSDLLNVNCLAIRMFVLALTTQVVSSHPKAALRISALMLAVATLAELEGRSLRRVGLVSTPALLSTPKTFMATLSFFDKSNKRPIHATLMQFSDQCFSTCLLRRLLMFIRRWPYMPHYGPRVPRAAGMPCISSAYYYERYTAFLQLVVHACACRLRLNDYLPGRTTGLLVA